MSEERGTMKCFCLAHQECRAAAIRGCALCATAIIEDLESTIRNIVRSPSPIESAKDRVVEAARAGAVEERARGERLRGILKEVREALCVWTHQYAPEFCYPEEVKKFKSKIEESGGTLAYIAQINKKILEALAADGK